MRMGWLRRLSAQVTVVSVSAASSTSRSVATSTGARARRQAKGPKFGPPLITRMVRRIPEVGLPPGERGASPCPRRGAHPLPDHVFGENYLGNAAPVGDDRIRNRRPTTGGKSRVGGGLEIQNKTN